MHKNRLSRILDLPREIDKRETKITIIAFDEMLIENYKGILEYEEFILKVNTELGVINICGFNLIMEQLTEEDILVKGKIESMQIERNI